MKKVVRSLRIVALLGAIGVILLPQAVYGMEVRPSTTIHFSGETSLQAKVVEAIRALKRGGSITVESPFLGQRLLKELGAASERGVDVSVLSSHSRHVNKRLRERSEEDEELKLTSKPGHHVKRITLEDPREKNMSMSPKKQVFVGSDNLSGVSWANQECMLTITDQELCKKHIEDAKVAPSRTALVKSPKKCVLASPKKKNQIYSSQKYNHIRSVIERIKTLKQSSDQTDSLEMSSMTFDDQRIVDALLSLKEKRSTVPVRLFFDKAALAHTNLLDQLAHSGVKVYIFNADGSEKIGKLIPKLQHTKLITRQCGGEKMTIVSTGNLTGQSNREVNVDTYFVDDSQESQAIFEDTRSFSEKLAKVCTLYEPEATDSESSQDQGSESESEKACEPEQSE